MKGEMEALVLLNYFHYVMNKMGSKKTNLKYLMLKVSLVKGRDLYSIRRGFVPCFLHSRSFFLY